MSTQNAATVVGTSAYGRVDRYGRVPEIPMERPSRRPVPQEERRQQPEPGVQTRTRTGTRAKTKAKAGGRQGVSLFACLGFLCVGIMAALVISSYIQLTILSEETHVIETEMRALQEEGAKLQIEYEEVYRQTNIEKYAIEVLGMSEPSSSQIYRVENFAGDQAVVLNETEKDYGILSRITAYLRSFVEYSS